MNNMGTKPKKMYMVQIMAPGIAHSQVISDQDDMAVLKAVLKKVADNAAKHIEENLPKEET